MTAPRNPADAIDEINERDGTSWVLASELPGGSRGAFLVQEAAHRAVLKVHRADRSRSHLDAAARTIEAGMVNGWNTPRWLSHGLLASGGFYVLREFIEGDVPRTLGEDELALLIEANRRQADVHPATDSDWSAYVLREVFGKSAFTSRLEEEPTTAPFRRSIRTLTARARDTLPGGDLVHGDFSLFNVIVSGRNVHLVDAEFAGKGTRGYDLATLLVHATTGDIGASEATRATLRRECVGVVGGDGLLVCVAARIIGLVAFGLEHWPNRVPGFMERCEPLLVDLAGAI